MPRTSLKLYYGLSKVLHVFFGKRMLKQRFEWLFWWNVKRKEKELSGEHYEAFFTEHFGLEREFYEGKKLLDIGCGPRGSLDWAKQAAERIGLDPLADKYKTITSENSITELLKGNAEEIPFEMEYFDVVSSFNSLDHVDDLDSVISEVKRVLKPGGTFLLISDIHKVPTLTEPSAFDWDIVKRFEPELEIKMEKHFEGEHLWRSLRSGVPFDHSKTQDRVGILSVMLRKLDS